MKFYIAGPIKGKDNRNEDAFRVVERIINRAGHSCIVPLDIIPYNHINKCPGNTSDAGESARHMSGCYMRADIQEMLACDAICLLDGWENSAGAKVEFLVAQACGLYIYYERDFRHGL